MTIVFGLIILRKNFPNSFDRCVHKPVKRDILPEALKKLNAEHLIEKPSVLQRAVEAYLKSPQYLRSIIEGERWINIEGEEKEIILEEEKESARQILDKGESIELPRDALEWIR